jgi:hypothetical protein
MYSGSRIAAGGEPLGQAPRSSYLRIYESLAHATTRLAALKPQPFWTKMTARDTIATSERPSVEKHARLTIEGRLGRQLSDQEWASYRSRLVAFFQLLRSWEKTSLP